MTLLFITQKLRGQDAFVVLWIREFIRRGYEVKVVCLEEPLEKYEFDVHGLGKKVGSKFGFGSKALAVFRFWNLIMTLRYDRVFIHMSPVWYVLGWKWWLLRCIPVYMWYTHYQMQLGVKLFGIFGKRFFCATSQSLPRYEGNPKKIVTGHGIDMRQWPMRRNQAPDSYGLLMVHRLSRSKRVELSLRALPLLPNAYTLDIYGIEAERDYVEELHDLIVRLELQHRVRFRGSISMNQLSSI